jgi:mannose/fructose-specific phosphotransferase system component IIA
MKYIIAGHNGFGESVASTLKFFKEDLNDLMVFDAEKPDYQERITETIDELDDSLIVFTDLMQSHANIVAMKLLEKHNFHLVSGANIAIMLELILSPSNQSKAIEEVVENGRTQICYMNQVFEERYD